MVDLDIVCYTGGTCGDLIAGLIDPTDVDCAHTTIKHSVERSRLKKPSHFVDDTAKDQYLQEIGRKYKSIPSHDLAYHLQREHKFVAITVTAFDAAVWAADRFRSVHRPHVWQEMMLSCGARTVDDYAQTMIDYSLMVRTKTSFTVDLADIRSGRAIECLQNLLQRHLPSGARALYDRWLRAQIQHG